MIGLGDICVCRHGETAWTLSDQHTGATDIPLTEHGRKQAALLGQRLKKINFIQVLSSPRLRAYETCQGAGFKEMSIEPDLQEWDYGSYEGLTSDEIKRQNPHWNIFLEGAPKGESPSDVSARADRVLEKLRAAKGNVLLFSHGHFSRVLAARWIQLNVAEGRHFYLCPASLSILGLEHNSPVIKLWNSSPESP